VDTLSRNLDGNDYVGLLKLRTLLFPLPVFFRSCSDTIEYSAANLVHCQ
jgi:hypothetical protein